MSTHVQGRRKILHFRSTNSKGVDISVAQCWDNIGMNFPALARCAHDFYILLFGERGFMVCVRWRGRDMSERVEPFPPPPDKWVRLLRQNHERVERAQMQWRRGNVPYRPVVPEELEIDEMCENDWERFERPGHPRAPELRGDADALRTSAEDRGDRQAHVGRRFELDESARRLVRLPARGLGGRR